MIQSIVNASKPHELVKVLSSDGVKDTSLKAKAEAKDSTLKAKNQGLHNCPPGSSRTRTCARGLQHW